MGAFSKGVEHLTSGSPSSIRWDIQALRGLAVALVIADHAKLSMLPGGFLGVDIFFVLSGFLMTGLITRALDEKRFSLVDFYSRRAWRILPAAYATVFVSALFSFLLLDPREYAYFTQQVFGAATFTTNYVLWLQIDYFNDGAATKPLLHMWSLAIEEQYYLIIPIILIVFPRQSRLFVASFLTLSSLAVCVYMVQRSPSAAFYFLPSRAWELGVGSVTAILCAGRYLTVGGRVAWILKVVSVAVLVTFPFLFDASGHPGWPALLVCLSTAWLVGNPTHLRKQGLHAVPVWIGDRSYSLYLVHWPIFAYANNVFIENPPLSVRIFLIGLAVVLACVQYHFVEEKFRHRAMSGRYVTSLVMFPVIALSSLYGWMYLTRTDGADFRRDNVGFAAVCAYDSTFIDRFVEHDECKSSARPSIIVWGDSFAMHTVPLVAASSTQGVIQATRTSCGPFLGVAPTNGGQYREPWARRCILFNTSVFEYIEQHPEITTVVLSSALTQYLGESGQAWTLLSERGDGSPRSYPSGSAEFQAAAADTIARLQAMGRHVVLVSPPATSEYDLGRCLQRRMLGYTSLPMHASCDFSKASFMSSRAGVIAFVEIEKKTGVSVVRLYDFTCRGDICLTMIDGVPLYRDKAHLSVEGGKTLGKLMDLKAVLRD
jgi:peptidoglycan/LPS O-acetylase OafA/YrhL